MVKRFMPEGYAPAGDLLANRTVLITGAGDGIGRAAARTFAAHGATVVLLGRTVAKLEAVYDEIVTAGHPQPAIYPMDLEGAHSANYEEMAERIEDQLGRLDGLLHNAGRLGYLTPLEQYDAEEWSRVLQVNLTAPFLITRACLPLLRRSDDASVVFTSSSVGRRGRAYWGAYAVSKFGVEGLMQTLADELESQQNIRVNTLNPGATRTAMRAMAYPGEDPMSIPAPDEIMPAYLFLMGPDSRSVTGQALDAR